VFAVFMLYVEYFKVACNGKTNAKIHETKTELTLILTLTIILTNETTIWYRL